MQAPVDIKGKAPDSAPIAYHEDPVDQLFDMQNDPGEMHNLSGDADHADTVRDLRKRLREWENQLTPAPTVPLTEPWRTLSI